MLNQTQQAIAWGPACGGKKATVSLFGTGKATVRSSLIEAASALNNCLIYWNYRTIYAQTGAFNCRKKRGSSGWSNHSYATAIDINWQRNLFSSRIVTDMPRAMIEAICRIRTNNGKQVWNWGGYWSGTKDAMHFEVVCRPSDIATGINWSTVPNGRGSNIPVNIPIQRPSSQPKTEVPKQPITEDEEVTKLIRNNERNHPQYGGVWAVNGLTRWAVTPQDYDRWRFFVGNPTELDGVNYDFFMRNTADITSTHAVNLTVLYIRTIIDRVASKLGIPL